MTVYEKLAAIQQKLIAPKSQYNSFGKYNYRSCEDILEGLKPCMKEVGAAVTVSDEVVMIGDRYYIKATARLIDTESGQSVENTAYARESDGKKGMDESQVTGSTSSYARKYALNGLFCIDDVKDADTRDNRQKGAEEQKKFEEESNRTANSLIPDAKVKALIAQCKKEGIEPEKIARLYKVNSLAELTERKFADINKHWADIKAAK